MHGWAVTCWTICYWKCPNEGYRPSVGFAKTFTLESAEVWGKACVPTRVKIVFFQPSWPLIYLAPDWREQAPIYGLIFATFPGSEWNVYLLQMPILGVNSCWVGNSDPSEEKEGTPALSGSPPFMLPRSSSPCNQHLPSKKSNLLLQQYEDNCNQDRGSRLKCGFLWVKIAYDRHAWVQGSQHQDEMFFLLATRSQVLQYKLLDPAAGLLITLWVHTPGKRTETFSESKVCISTNLPLV